MHIIIAVKYSKIKNKSKAAYICLIVGFFVNIVGILGLFMTLDDLKKKMAQNDKKQNTVAMNNIVKNEKSKVLIDEKPKLDIDKNE